MSDEERVPIKSDADIVTARQKGRELAARLGFSTSDQAVVATAISEIVRNMAEYAGGGEMTVGVASKEGRSGVLIVARDLGPGIPDVALAMQDGYSTHRGLGLGLPGAKRLMDEFDIVSTVGKGTTVTMRKWAR